MAKSKLYNDEFADYRRAVGAYKQGQADINDVKRMYKKLADMTDKRMLRLERYAKQGQLAKKYLYSGVPQQKGALTAYRKKLPKSDLLGGSIERIAGYARLTEYAYKTAKDSMQRIGLSKFNRKNLTIEQMSKAINIMQEFINSPSSSITGVRDVYKRRIDSLNESLDTDLSWEDITNFFDSPLYEKLKSMSYSSDFMFVVADKLKSEKDPAEMIRAVKDNSERFHVGNDVYDNLVNQAIKDGIFDDLL